MITIICVWFKTYMTNTDKWHELVKVNWKVPEVKKKVKEGTQNIDNLKQNKYTNAWPFYVLYAWLFCFIIS